jgi:hypothetical protein
MTLRGERIDVITSNTLNVESAQGSKMLLKIRQAALGKAADDLRTQRESLHEDFRHGRIEQQQFQKLLLQLLLKGKEIQQGLKDIEQKLLA